MLDKNENKKGGISVVPLVIGILWGFMILGLLFGIISYEFFWVGMFIGLFIIIGGVLRAKKEIKSDGRNETETGICPTCGAVIPIHSNECPECGEELASLEDDYNKENERKESRNFKEVKEKITMLKEEEKMIDVRAIESALEDGDFERANELLNELKENYQEYQDILDDLKELDDRMDKLSKRLAEGEIDNDSFKAAKESVDNKKYDLRNKLNKLRKEVIYEDYQKPF